MASRVAFSLFRAVTRFGDLPLGAKLLRITCFPYFIAKAAFAKDDTPAGAWRQSSLCASSGVQRSA